VSWCLHDLGFRDSHRGVVLESIVGAPGAWLASAHFAVTHRALGRKRKVVYALTPPASLSNVGDHAQAVAIRRWLAKHYADLPVLEVDKRQSEAHLRTLVRLVREDDLIFLHSGGNLGDRGEWSERVRRLLIQSFPNNRIVSLPQTIYFSDTERGRRERETTRRIYGAHRRLTVIGRDPHSGRLAAELFPDAVTFSMPDFVLSLPPSPPARPSETPKVLLCLREDVESALSVETKESVGAALGLPHERFDTTLPHPISPRRRDAVLAETLERFRSSAAVVTDRYHGLIFAVLCRRPTVVLPTVDHKLTSALDWFEDVPFVRLAPSPEAVPALLREVSAASRDGGPDWNREYFDRLPGRIG
jgi:pyruvyl transferase EpsI